MKLNNKGMTMVEVITSVALVSIVLIFMMNLFVRVRRIYNESKIAANYNILVSNVVKAVSDDIMNYGVDSVEWANPSNRSVIKITYNQYRTGTGENIVKYLKVTNEYIKYGYDESDTTITSSEKLTNMTRAIPEDATLNYDDEYIVYSSNEMYGLFKIVIPLYDSDFNCYNINIVGKVGA